jgi:hypothetical protein
MITLDDNRIPTNQGLRRLVDKFHLTKKEDNGYKNIFVSHDEIPGGNNCADLRECAIICYRYFGGKVIRGPYTPPRIDSLFQKMEKYFNETLIRQPYQMALVRNEPNGNLSTLVLQHWTNKQVRPPRISDKGTIKIFYNVNPSEISNNVILRTPTRKKSLPFKNKLSHNPYLRYLLNAGITMALALGMGILITDFLISDKSLNKPKSTLNQFFGDVSNATKYLKQMLDNEREQTKNQY